MGIAGSLLTGALTLTWGEPWWVELAVLGGAAGAADAVQAPALRRVRTRPTPAGS